MTTRITPKRCSCWTVSCAAEVNGWGFMIDASHFGRSLDGNDYDDYAPSQASALGLHAGYMWGAHYVGVFAGRNWFQGEEAATDNGTEHGNLYGVEGLYSLPNGTTSLFGQLGWADMAGDNNDTGFEGDLRAARHDPGAQRQARPDGGAWSMAVPRTCSRTAMPGANTSRSASRPPIWFSRG